MYFCVCRHCKVMPPNHSRMGINLSLAITKNRPSVLAFFLTLSTLLCCQMLAITEMQLFIQGSWCRLLTAIVVEQVGSDLVAFTLSPVLVQSDFDCVVQTHAWPRVSDTSTSKAEGHPPCSEISGSGCIPIVRAAFGSLNFFLFL